MTHAAIFKRFSAAILDSNVALNEPDIKSGGHMNVYVEGYPIRLQQALRADYPALLSILLGDKEFGVLASAYIKANPSQNFNLDRYPRGFFTFIKDKLKNPFALEIAKLEDAIARVFMAEESNVLHPSALAQLTPEAFSKMKLKPRSASNLMEFTYPANSWFNEWKAGNNPAIPSPQHEYIYIYRHHNNVQQHPLSGSEYMFLKQLVNGLSVEEAIEHMVTVEKQDAETFIESAQTWFGKWLAKGFFRVDS